MKKVTTKVRFLDSLSEKFVSRKVKDACQKVIDEYNEDETVVSPILKLGKFDNGDWDTCVTRGMSQTKELDLMPYTNKEGKLNFIKVLEECLKFLREGEAEAVDKTERLPDKTKSFGGEYYDDYYEEDDYVFDIALEEVLESYGFELIQVDLGVALFRNDNEEFDINVNLKEKTFYEKLIPTYIKKAIISLGYKPLKSRFFGDANDLDELEEIEEDEPSDEEIDKAVDEADDEDIEEDNDDEEEEQTYEQYLKEQLDGLNKSDFRHYLIKIILKQDKGWSYIKNPDDITGDEYDVVTPKNAKKIAQSFKKANK